jgi:hypothetical protein
MHLRPARSLPLLVALVAAFTPVVAHAKAPVKKPLCNLLTSPSSTGTTNLTPELDILSGDVASGTSEVGGTIRLSSVGWSSNPVARLGLRWVERFTAKGSDYIFTFSYSGGAESFKFTKDGSELKDAKGNVVKPTVKINTSGKAIEWRFPRKYVPGLSKQTFKEIGASTHRAGVSQDGATATKTYPDTWPSCFKVK